MCSGVRHSMHTHPTWEAQRTTLENPSSASTMRPGTWTQVIRIAWQCVLPSEPCCGPLTNRPKKGLVRIVKIIYFSLQHGTSSTLINTKMVQVLDKMVVFLSYVWGKVWLSILLAMAGLERCGIKGSNTIFFRHLWMTTSPQVLVMLRIAAPHPQRSKVKHKNLYS